MRNSLHVHDSKKYCICEYNNPLCPVPTHQTIVTHLHWHSIFLTDQENHLQNVYKEYYCINASHFCHQPFSLSRTHLLANDALYHRPNPYHECHRVHKTEYAGNQRPYWHHCLCPPYFDHQTEFQIFPPDYFHSNR